MPRKPRFTLPGMPQHIIQRGNNREPCFLAEDDYQCYLTELSEVATKFDCKVHAYVLMTNHAHLLITPFTEQGISNLMQALGRRYVYYFNKTYRRTGTLWEGRYKSCLIDSEHYLLTCMRYIELNPVRAGMVRHPAEYTWSSYHFNAQSGKHAFLASHPIYTQLGKSTEQRLYAYRELFRNHMDDDIVHDIRNALNHELVLGQSYFKDKIEEMTNRPARLGQPGRPKVEEEAGEYLMLY
jgi:putative transposase